MDVTLSLSAYILRLYIRSIRAEWQGKEYCSD